MPNNNVYQLDASQLRSQIFGRTSNGTVTAVTVDKDGNVGVIIMGGIMSTQMNFREETEQVLAGTTTYSASDTFLTSTMSTYTFAIYNHSAATPVAVGIEISPDNVLWTLDTTAQTCGCLDLIAIDPMRMLKYARLTYALSTGYAIGGTPATIDIWLDSQS